MSPDAAAVQIAHHELGHALAALRFRHRIEVVTIVPGHHFAGLTIHGAKWQAPPSEREVEQVGEARTPMELPARLRRRFEVSAIISLAGPVMDDLFRPWDTAEYVSEEPSVRPLPPITKRTAEALAAADAADDPDLERAMIQAEFLSPGAPIEAFAWLKAETTALVRTRTFRKALDLALPPLLERQTMTGAAVRRLLDEGGIA